MKYYLYNSKANNGIKPDVKGVELIYSVGINYVDFLKKLKKEDEVVLLGGDGTLNYFINAIDGYKVKNNIYLLGSGTGNDFFNDIERKPGEIVQINKYIEKLPRVKVNGLDKLFINNMGFGIDGYCCEVADQIKEKTPNKEINYTSIAIKGLLFHFKPHHATVTVDGVTHEFDNVWLAPTMKGRFYGGGMMVAPNQDRFSDELTCVVYMGKSRLKSLITFPSIFEGKHIEHKDMVKVMTGKKITVKYNEPCAAQIDGETVLNVLEYTAEI